MGLRIGVGFRPLRHVWIGASVPLGHARRLAAHQGHADGADPVSFLIGLAVMWVVARTLWGLIVAD